jgi:hypothetical protein
MARILTSLHGRKAGLDKDGRLIVPGGVVAGEHGNQFSLHSADRIVLLDDFTGDVVADQWNLLEGTDSATTDAAVLAGGIGGVLRLTTGDAGTGIAADHVQVTQALQWQASNGKLTFQTRLKLGTITNVWAYLGFTDLATSLEAPVTLNATTFTTNASDAVGFMFDTTATVDTWRMVGVKADVDAMTDATSKFSTDTAPVADTYATFRIEVDTSGNATFFYNGNQVGYLANAVTPGADLTPTLNYANLSGTTPRTMDVDYVYVAMDRGANGAST